MSLNLKIVLMLLVLATMVFTTPGFGRVETRAFSAYAACRKVAIATKGYAVWKHEQTIERMFQPRILFSDGFSTIHCRAIGIGPFWIVQKVRHTWAVCEKDVGNGKIIMCSEDYFGVSP